MQKITLKIVFIIIITSYSFPIEQDTIKIGDDSWKASIIPSINMTSFGQFDNDKPLKGLSLTLMKYYWYNEFKDAHEEDRISNRNRAFWRSTFLYFYTVMDAYIDSKLDDLPDNLHETEEE